MLSSKTFFNINNNLIDRYSTILSALNNSHFYFDLNHILSTKILRKSIIFIQNRFYSTYSIKFRIPNFLRVCLRQNLSGVPCSSCVWIIIVRLRSRQQKARWVNAFILHGRPWQGTQHQFYCIAVFAHSRRVWMQICFIKVSGMQRGSNKFTSVARRNAPIKTEPTAREKCKRRTPKECFVFVFVLCQLDW